MKLPSQLLRPLLLQDLRSRRTYAAKAHEKPKRSSSQGGMAEWLVIIPDHDGVLEQRMGIRKQHLEALSPNVEKGFWQLGGAILKDVQKPGAGLDICGSVMIAHAESREEVVQALRQDIYCTRGIWDLEKAHIYPFKIAVQQRSNVDQ